MAYRDYYSVLGVERGASHEDIQRAYKKLARKYHPDISKEPDAEDRFKELNNAYEVLKDEEKRKLYDRYGEDWKAVSEGRAPRASYEDVRSDFGQAGVHVEDLGDLESIFGSMFGGQPFGQAGGGRVRWSTGGMGGMGGGGGFGGQRQWKSRGSDYEAEIVLSLEDAFHGGERTLRFENPATREAQEHRVRIPPGGQDGSRIRLKGRGAPGQGGGPGPHLHRQPVLGEPLQLGLRRGGRSPESPTDPQRLVPVAAGREDPGVGSTRREARLQRRRIDRAVHTAAFTPVRDRSPAGVGLDHGNTDGAVDRHDVTERGNRQELTDVASSRGEPAPYPSRRGPSLGPGSVDVDHQTRRRAATRLAVDLPETA